MKKTLWRWCAVWSLMFPAACPAIDVNVPWTNSLAPRGQPGPEVTLAAGGKTEYSLVLPAQPTMMEAKAAEDLARWLKQITGTEFPVVREKKDLAVGGKVISIGRTELLSRAKIQEAEADLKNEGYGLAVLDQALFLSGGRTRGIINAVYALLEEDMGCRWYTSAQATVGVVNRIPSRPTLTFRPVPRRYVPQLEIRNPFYLEAFEADWTLCNRTNSGNAPVPEEWGGQIDYALFVHSFDTLVPPSLFDAHPEYFMLDEDGNHTPRQLCLSNPEVVKIATGNVLALLKENPHAEIISVSANDDPVSCHCPKCRALNKAGDPGKYIHEAFLTYYSPAGALIHFVNQIAEAVEKEYPQVLVDTLAYHGTQRAPINARARDNVAIRLCNHTQMLNWPIDFTTSNNRWAKDYREQIENWSKITRHLHVWEYTSSYPDILMPNPNMFAIGPAARFYAAHGVTGIFFQGMHNTTLNVERSLMRSWVMAKLLWDPSRDVAELQKDFIRGFYGQAAPAIAEYYDLLDDLAAGKFGVNEEEPDSGVPNLVRMAAPAAGAFLKRATAIFNRAEALAKDGQIQTGVELERLPIMYVELERGPECVALLGENYSSLIDRFEKIARRGKLNRLGYTKTLDEMLTGWRSKAPADSKKLESTERSK